MLLHNEDLKKLYKQFFIAFNMGISDIIFSESLLTENTEIPNDMKDLINRELRKEHTSIHRNNQKDVFIVEYKGDDIVVNKMQFLHKNELGEDILLK